MQLVSAFLFSGINVSILLLEIHRLSGISGVLSWGPDTGPSQGWDFQSPGDPSPAGEPAPALSTTPLYTRHHLTQDCQRKALKYSLNKNLYQFMSSRPHHGIKTGDTKAVSAGRLRQMLLHKRRRHLSQILTHSLREKGSAA